MDATIQARADYRSRFGNYRYRVEIVDSDEATENIRDFEIAISGAVINYESTEQDVYKPIISSTCTFSLICTTQSQIDFLRSVATSAIGRYGVRVLRADSAGTPTTTKWVGVLISDQLNFADNLPQEVVLTATDDLGYLNDMPYVQNDGSRFRGTQTILNHIQQALKKLRTRWYYDYSVGGIFNIEFSFENDLVASEYSSSSVLVGLLEETKINNFLFYDNESSEGAINCYQVLEIILKYFGASIYQSFEQDTSRFVITTFGSYQATVAGGYSPEGKTYRSNGVVATHGAATKNSVSITNDASNKKRLSGGSFTYLQPFRKVLRTLKVHDDERVFQRFYYEATPTSDAAALFSSTFATDLHSNFSNFSQGDVFKLHVRVTCDWPGIAANTLYTQAGETGTAPDAYKIGRIKVRLTVKLRNEDEDGASQGADQYLRRPQSNTNQVPIYDTSYGFSSYPQNYTNHIATTDVELSTNSSSHIAVTSEPFVITETQFLEVRRDFILPAMPFATDNGINVKLEVDFLDYTGAIAQNSGVSLITNNSNPMGFVSMDVFNGFQPTNDRIFKGVNTGNARKTFDSGEVLLNDGYTNSVGIVRYRKSDGSFSAENTGFTSNMQSASTNPSIKLITDEMANFYGTAREIFEGTLIKMSEVGLNGIFSLVHSEAGGDTTVKYKATKLSVNTGIEETQVSLVEIARNTTSTTGFVDVITTDDNITNPTNPIVSVSDIGGVYNLRSSIAENVGPVQQLLATAIARNRSSQTGEALATMDANGVLQEITDGSNGQFLTTNGSGVYSFDSQNFVYVLASGSMLLTMGREDFFYYGSNIYGWSSNIWNSSSSSSSSINDEYAHNGILIPYGPITRISFKATVRNDSNANDIDLTICKANRPNGSTSDITLTSIGTATASNSSGVDLHYNCDVDITGLNLTAGGMIFLLFRRQNGGNVSTNVNVSFTLLATI